MINYFVYKNGAGNFWAPLTEETNHLYVGFDDEWSKGSELILPATYDNGGEAPHDWRVGDLNHIRFVTHPSNRDGFYLVTFEKTSLKFWKVAGGVEEASSEIRRTAEKMVTHKGVYSKYFFRSPDPKGASPFPPFRVIPVTPIASISRHEVYTSIDSLGSYQYLIRGTCRPLWRAKGPDAAAMPVEIVSECQKVVPRCERVGEEQPFGAFVRMYFDLILSKRGKLPPVSSQPRLEGIFQSAELTQSLVLATLNPLLVETAAQALIEDLGLTADIGVSKGKDVVDIRGRASSSTGKIDRKVAAEAFAKLKDLGVKATTALSEKLLSGGTLDIQCKAADRKATASGVLHFGFFKDGQSNRVDVLPFTLLIDSIGAKKLPRLSRFIDMQKELIRGGWSSFQ